MWIKLDADANALYITFRGGAVTRTIAIADMVFADLDENGDPIGLDFVRTNDFDPTCATTPATPGTAEDPGNARGRGVELPSGAHPAIPSLSRDLVSRGFVQTTRSLDKLGMTTKAVLKRALAPCYQSATEPSTCQSEGW